MSSPVVALLAPTGNLGTPFVPTFVQHAKDGLFKSLKILTRRPEAVEEYTVAGNNTEAVKVSYDDSKGLAVALKGVDVLVSTLGNVEPPTLQAILDAAVAANIKIYIPSAFGVDYKDSPYSDFFIFQTKSDHVKAARATSIKVIDISTGPFLEWVVSPTFGVQGKTWNIPEDGTLPLAATSRKDNGRYAARVVVQAFESPSTFPDKVQVYSEHRPHNEYVDIVERVTGEKYERVYHAREEVNTTLKTGSDPFYILLAVLQTKAVDFTGREHTHLLNPGNKYFTPDTFESTLKKA